MTRPRITPISPIIGAGLFVLLLGILMVPTFGRLLFTWSYDPSYSHGYLILPLAIVLGVRRYWRAGPPHLADGNVPRAIAALIIGAFFHTGAVVVAWPLLDFVALSFFLRGLLIALGGGSWASNFNVPILFLFFMFALPLAWTTYVAIWLQDVVAQLSTAMLDPFFLVVRIGKSISIEGVEKPLIVAHECSGVRQLIMFTAVGVFLGEWSMRPWWARLLLVIAALPVSILANTIRVVMMAIGTTWFGLGWVNTGLHDVPAYLSVPLGCLLFLGVHVLIGRFVRPKTGVSPSPMSANAAPSTVVGSSRPCWIAAVLMACVLGFTVGLQIHLNAKVSETYTSMRAPLDQLPSDLPFSGQIWAGQTSASMDPLKEKLNFQWDDMVMRDYVGPNGAGFSVYGIYSRTGGDRYHHPEYCIRDAAGGTEILSARRRVRLGPGREAQFMRFQVGFSKVTSVYYWHYTFLPPVDRSATLLQALYRSVGRVPPSLTFEIFTDQTDPAFFAALERDVLPRLDAALYQNHLPESAKCGCQRFPTVLLRY